MHKPNRTLLTATIGISLMMLVGCGGSDSSDPTPIPSPSPSPSASPTTTLNAEQTRAATESAADATATIAMALDPLSYVSEGQPTVARATGTGQHPTVSVAAGASSISVNIDYGKGITGPGDVVRTGALTVIYSPSDHTGTVTFQKYTVNTHTVVGTVELSSLSISEGTVSFTAGMDIEIKGLLAATGGMSASLSSGQTSFPIANVMISPTGQSSYSVSETGIVVSPTTYGNFIPSAGIVTVPYAYTTPGGASATASVAVTFNDQSPRTGAVSASVNGGSQVSYTLPRFQ